MVLKKKTHHHTKKKLVRIQRKRGWGKTRDGESISVTRNGTEMKNNLLPGVALTHQRQRVMEMPEGLIVARQDRWKNSTYSSRQNNVGFSCIIFHFRVALSLDRPHSRDFFAFCRIFFGSCFLVPCFMVMTTSRWPVRCHVPRNGLPMRSHGSVSVF